MKKRFRILSVIGYILLFLFLLLGVLLAFTSKWLVSTWGLLSMDEVVYHLKASLEGTNPEMVVEYILHYGIWGFLVAVILFAGYFFFLRKKLAKRWIAHLLVIAISIGCMGGAVAYADFSLGIISYLKNSTTTSEEDFIADNYVDPASVEITFPEQKRNLIYIFLESMEATYTDTEHGGAFEQSVIPELTDLALTYEDFNSDDSIIHGGISLPGSTWTMGAMFAQSSGLPLKIPLASNQLEDQDDFFPSITTLGDVLEDNGYQNELLIGSDATFGGRRIYYEGHGDYDIHDYNYYIENGILPEDYYVFWGYEDEKLFEYAKEDLLTMASSDEPFNLTMLTVDTHFEDGNTCELCEDLYGEQYANVMACSSRQVANFVAWVQEQDFYENTTIVISGDHPTMDSDFCDNVDDSYQRSTYTCIINGVAEKADATATREFSTMDLFPTTLAAMGCTIEGDQLALGVNLYSDKPTLIETYGLDTAEAKLAKSSELMNKLSSLKLSSSLMETTKEKVYIDVEDDNGNIRFIVRKLFKTLNMGIIDKVVVKTKVTDPDSGEVTEGEYECELVLPNEDDPNVYRAIVTSDIPYSSLENMEASVYIWAGDYEDYYLVDYDPARQDEGE